MKLGPMIQAAAFLLLLPNLLAAGEPARRPARLLAPLLGPAPCEVSMGAENLSELKSIPGEERRQVVQDPKNGQTEWAYVAFHDPASGRSYVGGKHEIYVPTVNGIAGLSPGDMMVEYEIGAALGSGAEATQDWWSYAIQQPRARRRLELPWEIYWAFGGPHPLVQQVTLGRVISSGKRLSLSVDRNGHAATLTVQTGSLPWVISGADLDGKPIEVGGKQRKGGSGLSGAASEDKKK